MKWQQNCLISQKASLQTNTNHLYLIRFRWFCKLNFLRCRFLFHYVQHIAISAHFYLFLIPLRNFKREVNEQISNSERCETLSLSMVVSRNALTLDGSLTCEPANWFLTWCSVTSSQPYCALLFLFLLPGKFLKAFLNNFLLQQFFLPNRKFSTGKFIGKFSTNFFFFFSALNNFLISSEDSQDDDVFRLLCCVWIGWSFFFIIFNSLLSLLRLLRSYKTSVEEKCAENNFVFFSFRFVFVLLLTFLLDFSVFWVYLARCLKLSQFSNFSLFCTGKTSFFDEFLQVHKSVWVFLLVYVTPKESFLLLLQERLCAHTHKVKLLM